MDLEWAATLEPVCTESMVANTTVPMVTRRENPAIAHDQGVSKLRRLRGLEEVSCAERRGVKKLGCFPEESSSYRVAMAPLGCTRTK